MGDKSLADAYNIEFLDMGHNPNKDVVCFTWKNLDFEVDVVDGEVRWETLECLVEIVKQVDFPRGNGVRRDVEDFVATSLGFDTS